MVVELTKKEEKKNKKKIFQRQRRKHTREQKKQISAIGVNITKAISKKKLKIRYFNYNKKGYYINNYTKPSKN